MIIRSAYDPLPSQQRFHSRIAAEKLFLAGVGTGKTLCGVHEIAYLATRNKHADGAIVSPTYQMLRDVILPLWNQWIPQELYHFHKSTWVITWKPTGRSIFLKTASSPLSLSGLNLGYAWLDEAAQLVKPDAWHILLARIRDPAATERCLFATTTPLGYNWLIREFRKPGDRFVVRARTSDNIHLPPEFEANLRLVYGDELAAQYLDAMVLELAGLVWPIIPRVHVRPSADLAGGSVRRFGGVDWGFTNPACLVVGGIDGDGRWSILEEWYHRGKLRSEVATEARRLSEKWNIKCWWSDHDPEGVKQMKSKGKNGERGCNVRLAPKNDKSDLVAGIQVFRSLLPVRLDGQPRVRIAQECRNWLREVDAYMFPEEEEVPEGGAGDHAMDATRYMVYGHSTSFGRMEYYGGRTGRWENNQDDQDDARRLP